MPKPARCLMDDDPNMDEDALSLKRLAQYFDVSDFESDPESFVLNLHRKWKENTGKPGGKWFHSDGFLSKMLDHQETRIKSLVPKLGGRTRIQPRDGRSFVEFFLLHWYYLEEVGKFDKSLSSMDDLSRLYKPLLDPRLIKEIGAQVEENLARTFAQDSENDVRARSLLPGQDTGELIARSYKESDALITVSTQQTLIVANPKFALIGFVELINSLWKIGSALPSSPILIWILDLGRLELEDHESRLRFLNVEALVSRFRALKRFIEPEESGLGLDEREARWNWLKSHAVVVLRDHHHFEGQVLRSNVDALQRPSFSEDNVLLHTLPPSWAADRNFRRLYGEKFERLNQRNYSVFIRNSKNSALSDDKPTLCFFGHSQIKSEGVEDGELHARGVELPVPDHGYSEAFRTVYAASVHRLKRYASRDPVSGIDVEATRQLEYLGFRVLNIDEFLHSD